MNEVSCRVTDILFREIRKKGMPESCLIDNMPYSSEHLQNPHERLDWDSYLKFMKNASKIWTDEEFIRMGRSFFRSPYLRPVSYIAKLLFSAKEFYRYIYSVKHPLGIRFFSCIKPVFEEITENRIRLAAIVKDGYGPLPRPFMLITNGVLAEMTRIVGLKPAKVELTELPNGGQWLIEIPVETGFIRRLRKIIRLPFTFFQAGKELKKTYEILEERYQLLEKTNIILDRQATALKTAYTINTLFSAELELLPTLKAILKALVEVAGCNRADIIVNTKIEGKEISHTMSYGEIQGNLEQLTTPISVSGNEIGVMKLWTDNSNIEELLKYVIPTVAVAIDDALKYTVVVDYRNTLETKVIQRTEELQRVSTKLADTVEKLKKMQKARDKLFANISHEFRTPLTLIEGPAKQLSSDQYPAEVKENAGMITRNTKRLLLLVNQLLDLSRIESGQMKLHFQKLDMVYLLKSVAASFESLAASKEINFVFDLPSEPVIGYFDKDAMQKIITNLLSNAFKYTKSKGTVIIKLTNYSVSSEESINNTENSSVDKITNNKKGINDFLFIKITDTGIGIEEEELPHIFDRFYQVDASQTREQEGTGIGLSLTKELVELHGGEVNVVSDVGKGSSFIVKLPLGKEPFKPGNVVEMEEAENAKQEIIYEAPQIETKKIIIPEKDSEKSFDEKLPLMLIIEDNIDMRKYMRSNLDDMFHIIEAVNGEEGVQKAIQNIPDIIISDVMMPKVDGFQVCEILKLDERTSHIPIILLTAKADRKIEGLEIGADDYITKPFDAQELKVRVKNLIELRKKLREKFRKEGTFILKDDNITSADEKFLNRVMELAEKNISDRSFTTDKFASELFMSRMQLHRKMQGVISHSPGEFIRKIRMEKAKQLLSHRAGTIAEIAYQVGYEDPSRFSNAFRAQFGILPSEFLKEQSHNLNES